ncbi:MAG: hypothetical protein ABIQ95_12860 [Bdellovibrionia bacterium]
MTISSFAKIKYLITVLILTSSLGCASSPSTDTNSTRDRNPATHSASSGSGRQQEGHYDNLHDQDAPMVLGQCQVYDPCHEQLTSKIHPREAVLPTPFRQGMSESEIVSIVSDFYQRLEHDYKLKDKPDETGAETYKGHTMAGQEIKLRFKGYDIHRILGMEYAQKIAKENGISIKVPRKFVFRDPNVKHVKFKFNWGPNGDRLLEPSDQYSVYAEDIGDFWKRPEEEFTIEDIKTIEKFMIKSGFSDLGTKLGHNIVKRNGMLYLIDTEFKSFRGADLSYRMPMLKYLIYPLTKEASVWLDVQKFSKQKEPMIDHNVMGTGDKVSRVTFDVDSGESTIDRFKD